MLKCTQDISQVKETISNTRNNKQQRAIENKAKYRASAKGNRKHKYLFRGLSHRFTPRLHRCEGFPLSTEDFTRSTEDRSTELHHLQKLYQRVISTRVTKRTSNQVISIKITNSLQHFSLQLSYRMRIGILALEVQ